MAVPFAGTIIRVMSYLFGFVMKKYYTEQKLSGMVKVNIGSENSGIEVNCSELPAARAWLQITNLSPFPITVYGIEVELYLSGRVARFVSLSNEEIKASSEGELLIQTDLTGRQADHIKRNKGIDNSNLDIKMFLSCRLSRFEIDRSGISTKNIEFINCNNDF